MSLMAPLVIVDPTTNIGSLPLQRSNERVTTPQLEGLQRRPSEAWYVMVFSAWMYLSVAFAHADSGNTELAAPSIQRGIGGTPGKASSHSDLPVYCPPRRSICFHPQGACCMVSSGFVLCKAQQNCCTDIQPIPRRLL